MKKLIIFLAVAMCALTSAAFVGCADNTIEGQILREWKKDNNYYDAFGEPLSVKIYGEYGETYVFFVGGLAAGTAITVDIVANVYFSYSTTQQFEVYNSGRFYSLGGAYDAGLLTRENLLDLQQNYSGGSERRRIAEQYIRERGDQSLAADDIDMTVYWAGYEIFVLFINAEGDGFDMEITEEVVDGVQFTYPTSQQLMFYGIYNEEEATYFNTLSWAFEESWLLTHADLKEIAQNYQNDITISVG